MFSIVIATHDSERALVPTLAALVPGATAGVVREVIVADGGSQDKTEEVADIAGCRFFVSTASVGTRLKTAAQQARGDWLMFLQPGAVPRALLLPDASQGLMLRKSFYAALGGHRAGDASPEKRLLRRIGRRRLTRLRTAVARPDI
jgi:hypothetical protein